MFDNDEVIISSGNIIQRKYDANGFPKGVRVAVPQFELRYILIQQLELAMFPDED